MPHANQPNDDAALLELEELLCAIAAGRPPNRAEATSYSNCRSRLLGSWLRPTLPGFLYQCISLLRFKDFITLYDPDIAQRQRFLHRSFDPSRSMREHMVVDEPVRRRDADPQHWML